MVVPAYPPPDVAVRNYFSGHKSKSDNRLQAEYCIFLGELFQHTMTVAKLENLGASETSLAEEWADYLMEGQGTGSVGDNRRTFFKVIVENANRVINSSLNWD